MSELPPDATKGVRLPPADAGARVSPPAERGNPPPPSFWRIYLGIALAIIGAIVLGSQMTKALPQPPLPVVTQTTGALKVTERSGRTVQLVELRGKVTVMACLYTVCPHGCAAIIEQMRQLNDAHRARTDFHQVSLSVAPERDSTSFLQAYADGVGVKKDDPWWFVTGDQRQIWDYMTNELKMEPPKPIPEEKRLNPLDFYEHDLRIVLLDKQGRVRGFYSVFHPQPEITQLMCEKLKRDVWRLLEE
jgi:cytochrome oxidase Cu insertion factor (SCO1/SenC/PrrC family)